MAGLVGVSTPRGDSLRVSRERVGAGLYRLVARDNLNGGAEKHLALPNGDPVPIMAARFSSMDAAVGSVDQLVEDLKTGKVIVVALAKE